MAKKQTYYYHQDKLDDFGTVGHNEKPLKDNYKYIHKNIFWRIASFILFYFIAFPILYIISKICLGVKVKNKKQFRKKLKKGEGFFIYSNHCHYFDAFLYHLFVGFPNRTYVLSHADPTNIPIVKTLIALLGCFPLPNNVKNYKNFSKAMKYVLNKGSAISIYPEGTLWPYYNGLRPMPKACFKYAAINAKPIVLVAETWRKPKFFKFLKPRLTLTISDLIRIDENKNIEQNTDFLYEKSLLFFEENVLKDDNISYHKYLPIETKENS